MYLARLRQALAKYTQIPLIFAILIHFQQPNTRCNHLITNGPPCRILQIGAVPRASLSNDIPYFLHLSQETRLRGKGNTDTSAFKTLFLLQNEESGSSLFFLFIFPQSDAISSICLLFEIIYPLFEMGST